MRERVGLRSMLLIVLALGSSACNREAPSSAERTVSGLPAVSGAEVGLGRRIALVVGNSRYATAPLRIRRTMPRWYRRR